MTYICAWQDELGDDLGIFRFELDEGRDPTEQALAIINFYRAHDELPPKEEYDFGAFEVRSWAHVAFEHEMVNGDYS